MGVNTEKQRGYVENWRRRKKRAKFKPYTLTMIIIMIIIMTVIIIKL